MFSDASKEAFGWKLFMRVLTKTDGIQNAFVKMRSSVGGMGKNINQNRGEMEAALFACEGMEDIANELTLPIDEKYFWVDSNYALKTIKNDRLCSDIFIAARVFKIRLMADPKKFYFCPGIWNPADETSRGSLPAAYAKSEKSLEPPAFLYWENPFIASTFGKIPPWKEIPAEQPPAGPLLDMSPESAMQLCENQIAVVRTCFFLSGRF